MATLTSMDLNVGLVNVLPKYSQIAGYATIAGAVTKLNIAFPCLVRIYDRRTGQLMFSNWTDNTGHYSFSGLVKDREYSIIAFDHTRQYNAVVQDMVKAV